MSNALEIAIIVLLVNRKVLNSNPLDEDAQESFKLALHVFFDEAEKAFPGSAK